MHVVHALVENHKLHSTREASKLFPEKAQQYPSNHAIDVHENILHFASFSLTALS
ncbi:hypothetical protein [Methylotenera sp. 73s]|nr:hypothetical protein [Methylotenera sp. 73s]